MDYVDDEYLWEEYGRLISSIENNTFEVDKCNNFISENDLNYEFSLSAIRDAQYKFEAMVTDYLIKNYPKKYAVWTDWCVHVCTAELHDKIRGDKVKRGGKSYVVGKEMLY